MGRPLLLIHYDRAISLLINNNGPDCTIKINNFNKYQLSSSDEMRKKNSFKFISHKLEETDIKIYMPSYS